MALIICPECSGKVSDKAAACPHCGYPINSVVPNKTAERKYDLKLVSAQSKVITIKIIHEITGLSLEDAKKLVDTGNQIIISNIDYDQATMLKTRFKKEKTEVNIVPHSNTTDSVVKNELKQPKSSKKLICPRCCSTSITTGARGVDGFWGFFGASRTVNRCANCGHSWEPRG